MHSSDGQALGRAPQGDLRRRHGATRRIPLNRSSFSSAQEKLLACAAAINTAVAASDAFLRENLISFGASSSVVATLEPPFVPPVHRTDAFRVIGFTI